MSLPTSQISAWASTRYSKWKDPKKTTAVSLTWGVKYQGTRQQRWIGICMAKNQTEGSSAEEKFNKSAGGSPWVSDWMGLESFKWDAIRPRNKEKLLGSYKWNHHHHKMNRPRGIIQQHKGMNPFLHATIWVNIKTIMLSERRPKKRARTA